MLSSDVDQHIQTVLVTQVQGVLHSMLSFPLPIEVHTEACRVTYPPLLDRVPGSKPMPFDWDGFCSMIDTMHLQWKQQQEEGDWDDRAVQVQRIWDCWQDAYRNFLASKGLRAVTRDRETTVSMGAFGNVRNIWKQTKQKKHSNVATSLAHRAVGWLANACQSDEAKVATAKILKERHRIAETLRLQESAIMEAVRHPQMALPKWKRALQQFDERQRQTRLRAWRGKLFKRGAQPTKTLFRWLRKECPPMYMCVRHQAQAYFGPRDFFHAERDFWGDIMHQDPVGHHQGVVSSTLSHDRGGGSTM